MDQHYANKEAEQQQEMYIQDQMAQEQYAAPPEQAAEVDLTSKLQQLADLHESGVLNDEEFAAAKQKLLAG
jgi:hypothetical protein